MENFKEVLSVTPNRESMLTVMEYIEGVLEESDVPMKLTSRMGIATDEVWSNVVNYSGATSGEVGCRVADGRIVVCFRDNGKPFDPLAKADPDVNLALDERKIGGLGIFMTKKLMTHVEYAFLDGRNTLTLTLNLA